jgi:hypothetical protein
MWFAVAVAVVLSCWILAFYYIQAVVPSVAWDFLFDKHLPNLLNFSLSLFSLSRLHLISAVFAALGPLLYS